MIEINCDMGEVSYDSNKNIDKLFMPYIHACNIATGAHAGDLETMVKTMCFAKLQNVKIGIHPSYVDRENFGRKAIDESTETTLKSLERQIDIFKTIAAKLEYNIDHLKAHGALYHELSKNEELASGFLELIDRVLPDITIYAMSGSPFAQKAEEAGFKVKHEVFADRRYQNKLNLVSRSETGALIEDEITLLDQLNTLIKEGSVQTIDAGLQSLKVDTICIHSDTPNALSFAKIAAQYLKSVV